MRKATYYKNLTTGAVIESANAPEGKWWREATEREFLAYKARVARAVGALDRAVAYKARLLKA